jgi:hypothetical protein
MHCAKRVAEQFDDYFVIVKRFGQPRARPRRWTWEIRRRSKPLVVQYYGNEFATPQDAKLSGETALKDLFA